MIRIKLVRARVKVVIDLHMHTKNSDGVDDVVGILKKAEERGLEYISITDHDKLDAYHELERIDSSKYYSGKIVKGVELKCWYDGRLIEILGYDIDLSVMSAWLREFYKDKDFREMQGKYLDKLYDVFKSGGFVLDVREDIVLDVWADLAIFYAIKKYPENKLKLPKKIWEDARVFGRRGVELLGSKFSIDQSEDYPTPKRVIDAIHEAGGKAFLAHLYVYGHKDEVKLLKDVVEWGVDGVECFYPTFTAKQTDFLANFCWENGLLMSGGSDYHGEGTSVADMGAVDVPNEVIEAFRRR
jgi:predicted metal-dependent phosphoesterase TrpH